MKKSLFVFILIITFVGGYALSFGINHWCTSNLEESSAKVESSGIYLTSLAFKVNILDKNKELLGVGYIPTKNIDEMMKEDQKEIGFLPPEVIPTLDVEMVTDIPIAKENEKYGNYIVELYSEIYENGEEARFVP